MKTNTKRQIRSNLLLMTTALVWGFAFVAQVMASESHMGSFFYNGVRYLLGALILLPIFLIFERKKINRQIFKSTFLASLICGAIMMAAVNFQQYGIDNNMNAGKSGFITGLYMVFIPIAGIFFKQKTSHFTWIAVIIALVGLFLISFPAGESTFNREELLGDLLVLISAFFWTAQILCVDRFAKGSCPILFSVLQFAVCGTISMLIALFVDDISFTILSAAALPLLYGGLVSVGVGYTLQVLGQRDASPAVASIAMASESLFAAIGGALILKETMTLRQIFGALLMLAAILLAQIKPKKTADNNLQ